MQHQGLFLGEMLRFAHFSANNLIEIDFMEKNSYSKM